MYIIIQDLGKCFLCNVFIPLQSLHVVFLLPLLPSSSIPSDNDSSFQFASHCIYWVLEAAEHGEIKLQVLSLCLCDPFLAKSFNFNKVIVYLEVFIYLPILSLPFPAPVYSLLMYLCTCPPVYVSNYVPIYLFSSLCIYILVLKSVYLCTCPYSPLSQPQHCSLSST